ncbi:MAG: hypothetical protein KDD82_14725, partial [Planctomycetes bacterium]|nr:hypothetical protein [Planctomycetota bacterium]
ALDLSARALRCAAPRSLTLLATRAAVAAGRYPRAASTLRLLERAGKTWETDLLGARIAYERRDPEALRARLEACVDEVPRELSEALLEVVALLERTERGEEALRVLREARAPTPLLRLTRAHFEALYGEPGQARVELEAALSREPELRRRALADPALRAFMTRD